MDSALDPRDQEKRFKILFDRYNKPAHDYIRAIVGSHELAEEITQEVFIRLWRKKTTFDEIENIDFYIFRIARNECMRYFKRAAVETQLFRDLQHRMAAGDNNITDYINYKETEELLNKAISSLSPRRQQVYQLSRRHGLRIDEIALEMKLSYNTVRNHLVEALRQIRHYYLKYLSVSLLLYVHSLLFSCHVPD